MIIQLKGQVEFPITLDPTVWIFDDRKVLLEDAFKERVEKTEVNPAQKAEELFNQEIYSQKSIKPPVNKSLNREEREKALKHSFVMPIKDFLDTAKIDATATAARLLIPGDDDCVITIDQLYNASLLFAIDGKPIRENGPVHLFFGDGSNQDSPIKGIKQIVIE